MPQTASGGKNYSIEIEHKGKRYRVDIDGAASVPTGDELTRTVDEYLRGVGALDSPLGEVFSGATAKGESVAPVPDTASGVKSMDWTDPDTGRVYNFQYEGEPLSEGQMRSYLEEKGILNPAGLATAPAGVPTPAPQSNNLEPLPHLGPGYFRKTMPDGTEMLVDGAGNPAIGGDWVGGTPAGQSIPERFATDLGYKVQGQGLAGGVPARGLSYPALEFGAEAVSRVLGPIARAPGNFITGGMAEDFKRDRLRQPVTTPSEFASAGLDAVRTDSGFRRIGNEVPPIAPGTPGGTVYETAVTALTDPLNLGGAIAGEAVAANQAMRAIQSPQFVQPRPALPAPAPAPGEPIAALPAPSRVPGEPIAALPAPASSPVKVAKDGATVQPSSPTAFVVPPSGKGVVAVPKPATPGAPVEVPVEVTAAAAANRRRAMLESPDTTGQVPVGRRTPAPPPVPAPPAKRPYVPPATELNVTPKPEPGPSTLVGPDGQPVTTVGQTALSRTPRLPSTEPSRVPQNVVPVEKRPIAALPPPPEPPKPTVTTGKPRKDGTRLTTIGPTPGQTVYVAPDGTAAPRPTGDVPPPATPPSRTARLTAMLNSPATTQQVGTPRASGTPPVPPAPAKPEPVAAPVPANPVTEKAAKPAVPPAPAPAKPATAGNLEWGEDGSFNIPVKNGDIIEAGGKQYVVNRVSGYMLGVDELRGGRPYVAGGINTTTTEVRHTGRNWHSEREVTAPPKPARSMADEQAEAQAKFVEQSAAELVKHPRKMDGSRYTDADIAKMFSASPADVAAIKKRANELLAEKRPAAPAPAPAPANPVTEKVSKPAVPPAPSRSTAVPHNVGDEVEIWLGDASSGNTVRAQVIEVSDSTYGIPNLPSVRIRLTDTSEYTARQTALGGTGWAKWKPGAELVVSPDDIHQLPEQASKPPAPTPPAPAPKSAPKSAAPAPATSKGRAVTFDSDHGFMLEGLAAEGRLPSSVAQKVNNALGDGEKARVSLSDAELAQVKKALAGADPGDPSVRSLLKRLNATPSQGKTTKALDDAARAAEARIDARRKQGKQSLGSLGGKAASDLAEDVADYAIIGAAKMAKGALKFADWSAEMVAHAAARRKDISGRLPELWEAAKVEYRTRYGFDAPVEGGPAAGTSAAPKSAMPASSPSQAQPQSQQQQQQRQGATGKPLKTRPAPYQGGPYKGLDPASPEGKLAQLVRKAKPVRAEAEAMYRTERRQRAARLTEAQAQGGGEAGFGKELSVLKGELPKPAFEAPRGFMQQTEIDALFDRVKASDKVKPYEKVAAQKGLRKVINGEGIPGRYELGLLEKVFGKDFAASLMEKRSWQRKVGEFIAEGLGSFRALQSSFDISAPGRQAAVLTASRPRRSVPAFWNMLKSYASEDAYKKVMEGIEKSPNAGYYADHKLSLTTRNADTATLTNREEAYLSNLFENLGAPDFGLARTIKGQIKGKEAAKQIALDAPRAIAKGVRSSERAYVAYLNQMRAGVFDDFVAKMKKRGITPENNPKLFDQYAEYINDATGRGKLKAGVAEDFSYDFERHADLLGQVFYSPRFQASRVRLMNPVRMFAPGMKREARIEYLRDMAAFVGTGITMMALASQIPGVEVGVDARSSDFGKIRYGKTTIDVWAGFSQWARYYAQMATGEVVSAKSGKVRPLDGSEFPYDTRLTKSLDFARTKLAPVPGIAANLMDGQDVIGQPFGPGDIPAQLLPLYVKDVQEAFKQEGVDMALLSFALGVTGVGVNTEGERKEKPTRSKSSNNRGSGGSRGGGR